MNKTKISLAIAASILVITHVQAGDIENTLPTTTDAMTVKQGTTELMRVNGAGNVGIGTNIPTRRLHVVAPSEEGAAEFTSDSGKSGIAVTLNSANPGDRTSAVFQSYRTSDGKLDWASVGAREGMLSLSSQGSNVPDMAIVNSGNVGIGTTTPTEKLDVTGNIKASGTVCDSVGCIGDSAGGKFVDGDTATDAVFATGNVGIGTTTPESTLHIVKDFQDQGTVIANKFDLSANPQLDNNAYHYGILNNTATPEDHANYTRGLVGMRNTVTRDGTGNAYVTAGIQNTFSMSGEGTVSYASSQDNTGNFNSGTTNYFEGTISRANVSNNATASNINTFYGQAIVKDDAKVSNMSAFATDLRQNSSQTIDNVYGIKVSNPLGTGDITNVYGLYINDINRGSTNNYGIYSGGGTNYFADNVGIGTTTPSTSLEVVGQTQTDRTNGNQFVMADDTGVLKGSIGGRSGTGDAGDIRINPINDSGLFNTRVIVKGDTGNVGIGTQTPKTKLHISDSFPLLSFTDLDDFTDVSDAAYIRGQGNGLSLGFYDDSGATPQDQWKSKFHFDGPTGNVGIGTTTPNSMLEITTADVNRPIITLNNTSGNNRNSFINFKGTSGGEESTYSIFQWSAGQNLTISSSKTPGSTNIARFWGDTGDVSIDNGELLSYGTGNNYFAGNVGIGTPTPTSKLQVTGLPIHADNATAKSAGLTNGAFFHNGDGILRVVF